MAHLEPAATLTTPDYPHVSSIEIKQNQKPTKQAQCFLGSKKTAESVKTPRIQVCQCSIGTRAWPERRASPRTDAKLLG